MSQIEYNTNWANARKDQRNNLQKELKLIRRDLIQLIQEIDKLDTTDEISNDDLRTSTATRVHQHLEQNFIPSAKEGARKDQEDKAIYNNEMDLLP